MGSNRNGNTDSNGYGGGTVRRRAPPGRMPPATTLAIVLALALTVLPILVTQADACVKADGEGSATQLPLQPQTATSSGGEIAVGVDGSTSAGATVGIGIGIGSGSGSAISASLRPIERNEDGTYYPGDIFAVDYQVAVPPSGVYYDHWGNPCQYHYSFISMVVRGAHIDGGTSYWTRGTIVCRVSADAPAGKLQVEASAQLTYHYQYWVNETYPIYDEWNGTVSYGWRWVPYWTSYTYEDTATAEIEVVEYDPHFTLALYPITNRETDLATYWMDLALLVRYDGNGPSRNLMQRAVIDSHSATSVGTGAFFVASEDDLVNLFTKGFYGLRQATAEDFATREDINALNLTPSSLKSLFGILLNATYGGTPGSIYIGYRICPEYGPYAAPDNFTSATLFNSTSRYAKYVFTPKDPKAIEDLVGALDINITLSWSRFPSSTANASAALPYLKVRVPLTVKTVALTPEGAFPAVANINFSVALVHENDTLFSSFFEPPALATNTSTGGTGPGAGAGAGTGAGTGTGGGEGGGGVGDGDEWFAQQWAADNAMPLNATAPLVTQHGEGTSLTAFIPRTSSCHYNLTVLTSAPGNGNGTGGGGYPYEYGLGYAYTNTTSTCGWVTILVDFDAEGCEVAVNINPDAASVDFVNHLSWVALRVTTPNSNLKNVTVFSLGPSGERTKWGNFSWYPAYAGEGIVGLGTGTGTGAGTGTGTGIAKGARYDLWAEKPKTLSSNTTVYIELTDVWGNTQVLEAGTATPYAEGFYDIPYSGILTVFFMVISAMILYEVLQRAASRL